MPNIDELTKDQIGFLLLADRLVRRKQDLRADNILALAQIKLPGVGENFQELLESLSDLGLFQVEQDQIVLTELGSKLVQQAGTEHSLVGWFYDEFYRAAENSPAHAEFCRRTYGLDLVQHGMADQEQLEILVEEIGLASGQSFLDFGCGSGRITEFLVDQTETRAAGIDKSPGAIELAQNRTAAKSGRLAFYYADIQKNRGEVPQGPFDKIIAIDSLFFAPDQELVFQTLFDRLQPEGMLGIFYISSPDHNAEDTTLGNILADQDLPHSVMDLSAHNKAHWIKKKQVLLEMEAEFLQEGSSFIYQNRLAECQGNMHELKRYLYLIPRLSP